jgi:hypothetical protein
VIDVTGDAAGKQPGEPTPWVTGLIVSAVAATVVGVALLSLSQDLASNGVWLVVMANFLVALGRATPIWRWVAYGTAAGIVLTWLILLLSQLG